MSSAFRNIRKMATFATYYNRFTRRKQSTLEKRKEFTNYGVSKKKRGSYPLIPIRQYLQQSPQVQTVL